MPAPAKAPSAREKRRAEARKRGSDQNYNADERTRKQTEAEITVGGKVYRRRIKDNDVSGQLLDLQEDQEIANRKAFAFERQMADLDPADIVEWEELRAKVREHADEATAKSYELLSLMLRDEEGHGPPINDLHKLDATVIVDLTERLAGGGEPLEGPTATSAS